MAHGLALAAVVLTLLLPTLVMALDHHGVERLPDHEHLAPTGQSPPGHEHRFHVAHTHGSGGTVDAVSTLPTVRQVMHGILATGLAEATGAPVVLSGLLLCFLAGRLALTPCTRLVQFSSAPPTRPPTVPLLG